MPKEKESDTTELIKQIWGSQVDSEANGLKQELEAVRVEFERRGTSGSGQHFSTEANTIASHLRKLVETCIDQIVDDKRGVPVDSRDESFWNQVARILVPRLKQYLRSHIGALRNTAKLQGAGSGIDTSLSQQEQQIASDIEQRIHARTRELALRDKLSRSDQESASDSSIKPETEMKQTSATENRPYDVAFSFAGEDREYVDKVAKILKDRVKRSKKIGGPSLASQERRYTVTRQGFPWIPRR